MNELQRAGFDSVVVFCGSNYWVNLWIQIVEADDSTTLFTPHLTKNN